jgi:hypothetical protein
MDEKLLSLPWQIQVALGSGYAAYMLAYVGIRDHHKAVDITFKSIAFGLIAIIVLLATMTWNTIWSIIAAVGWSLVAGFVWRRWGMEGLRKILHMTDASWADDTPSAWATISVCNSKHMVSQISVELDDGTWLQCENATQFKDEPFGPMTLGANGDVAFYVTNEKANGSSSSVNDVIVPYWGSEITYIPASKIRRICLRHYTGG